MVQSSYPIILTALADARCVVVGGGPVAERKVAGLLDAGAQPTVISPTLTPTLAEWKGAGRIMHLPRVFAAGDLAGAALVIAATDDDAVNTAVATEGRDNGALVNVANEPAVGNFHTVGTVRRGDLLLTVSTGGRSPTLAAQLRAELASRYGPEYAAALRRMAQLRAIPDTVVPPHTRRALAAWLCSEQALGWLCEGSDDRVDAVLQQLLTADPTPTGASQ